MMDVEPELTPAGRLRVAIIAAYSTARAGLRAVVQDDPGLVVISESPDDDDSGADVLVIDAEGAEDADGLLSADDRPAVVLWPSPDPGILVEPARAHLLHDATPEEIHAAIRAVALGLSVIDPALLPALAERSEREEVPALGAGERLTQREHEVLRLLADGLTNKAIARRLGISDHTAKFHVGAILSKLDAESRTEAVSIAARTGLLPL